jgi:CheY-like chemotaxis protein
MEALNMLSRSTFAINHATDAPSYDVCLMDIEMPVMDGITACHRIRELENSGQMRHVPLIAVTANARQEQIDHMIQQGFDDVLTKPFQLPDLLALMGRVLGRSVERR